MSETKIKKSIFECIGDSSICRTLISILLGFFVVGIILEIMGFNTLYVYKKLLDGVVRNNKTISNTITYSTPYILTGLSVVLAFKAKIFNIGAEGQFVIGSLMAGVIGIVFNELPSFILVPFCIIGGMIGGALWGFIVAMLKIKFNINDILSMIMFNWIALYLSNFIIKIPFLSNENGYNAGRTISKNAMIIFDKNFIDKYGLSINANPSIIWVIVIAILIHIIIKKTTFGYEIKAVGKNIDAAKFNGINVNKVFVLTLVYSASLSGLAGALHIIGNAQRVSVYIAQEGFGFGGIVVALVGLVEPIGCIFAGIFYGALKFSGRSLNLIDVPTQVIDIIVGIIVFFISISSIFKYLGKIKIGGKKQ